MNHNKDKTLRTHVDFEFFQQKEKIHRDQKKVGMGWEEDILSHIAPSGKRKRSKKVASDSDESDEYQQQNSDLDPVDSDKEDPEWAEVKSWNKKDLMGDSKDRKRLFAMSELEREMELAERRKKFDALEERIILQNRLKSQKQQQKNPIDRKLSEREKKGRQLEDLRKKREKKAKSRSNGTPKSEKKKKSRDFSDSDSEVSDYYQDYEEGEGEIAAPKITYENVLSIQLRRDDAEKWLYKPDFEKTIRGCFARLSLGTTVGSGSNREPVYRCVYIAETPEYHRKYKFNNTYTNIAIVVSHGKAKKQYLMDMLSNQPITTKEWSRYELACQSEKVVIPSMNHVKRKSEEVQKIRDHIFTEEEFNEMLKKKKNLKQTVVNTAFERVRLMTTLESARQEGDYDKVEDIKLMLKDLDDIDEAARLNNNTGEDLLAKVNASNRVSDLKDHQVAEKAALIIKRQQGVNESDPFARRKTAPVHVVNAVPKTKALVEEADPSNSISKSLSAEDLPASEDEDPFDSVDVSILEEDLGI